MKIRVSLKYFVSYCSLPSNTGFLSQQPARIQINVLKGGTTGFYFLIEEIVKTVY